MKKWCLLHTKPHKEDFLWGQIIARNLDGFYPKLLVKTINPRARKEKPYFPGYIFIQQAPENGDSDFRWLPGSNGLVRFGGEIATVPDGIVNAIRAHVTQINASGTNALTGLKPGDSIEITEGPFTGYEAIFDARISGNERVRVLLQMVNSRMVSVEMAGSVVKPKNRR
jgi:transcriptional antiterminator RfaH